MKEGYILYIFIPQIKCRICEKSQFLTYLLLAELFYLKSFVSGCIINSFRLAAAAAVYIYTPAAPKNMLRPSYSSRLHNSSVCLQT